MAPLLVRNLEQSVKEELLRLARLHGRTIEEEAREILRNSVGQEQGRAKGLGSQIAACFVEGGWIAISRNCGASRSHQCHS
jgi:plasmid stability protein